MYTYKLFSDSDWAHFWHFNDRIKVRVWAISILIFKLILTSDDTVKWKGPNNSP